MLTDRQIVKIRNLRARGETVKALAAAAGVSPQTISNITTGYRRRDAGGPIVAPAGNHVANKVTPQVVAAIKRLRRKNKSLREIAAAHGLSAGTVCKHLAKAS